MTTLHGQRLRSRTILHKVADTADRLSFVPALFWLRLIRLGVWTVAVLCYLHGWRFEALLMLVVGLNVQSVILSVLLAGRGG